jgi:Fur family ferric uptake transcriptional regulator
MKGRFEAQCRAIGMPWTRQRRLIVQVLFEAHDHPDVPELHRRVRRHDARVSEATVYRMLKLLENAGILERHAFRNGRFRYEKAAAKHHDHLIDVDTGQVIEFRNAEIERLQKEVAKRLGYSLVGHRLELYASQMGETRVRKASLQRRRPRGTR